MTSAVNSGDYVTPGGSYVIPNAATRPGGGDDNGVTVHGASVVQLQEQAWRARATAALAAAEELRTVHATASKMFSHNYFGEGCPEGTAVYDALRDAIAVGNASWSAALKTHVTELEQLARACTTAAVNLSASDSTAGATISSVDT